MPPVERAQPLKALVALERQMALLQWVDTPEAAAVAEAWAQVYGYKGIAVNFMGPLRWGAPVFLDARIGRMLWDSLSTFPADAEFRERDVPMPFGFLWLENGPELPEGGGHLEAIAWATSPVMATDLPDIKDAAKIVQRDDADGIILVAFADRAESGWRRRVYYFDRWKWGSRMFTDRAISWLDEDFDPRLGGEIGLTLEDYRDARASIFARSDFVRGVAYSVWHFMKQRIATVRVQRPDRATRRRLEAAKHPHSEVQIIELRAKASERYERVEEAAGSPLTVRFVVRGHWRNQWFPSRKEHDTIWIEPYVKGPDGAPFHGGLKLFDVNR